MNKQEKAAFLDGYREWRYQPDGCCGRYATDKALRNAYLTGYQRAADDFEHSLFLVSDELEDS